MSYKPKQYDLNKKHFTLYEHLLNFRIKMLVRIKSVLDLPLYIIIVRQRVADNIHFIKTTHNNKKSSSHMINKQITNLQHVYVTKAGVNLFQHCIINLLRTHVRQNIALKQEPIHRRTEIIAKPAYDCQRPPANRRLDYVQSSGDKQERTFSVAIISI